MMKTVLGDCLIMGTDRRNPIVFFSNISAKAFDLWYSCSGLWIIMDVVHCDGLSGLVAGPSEVSLRPMVLSKFCV